MAARHEEGCHEKKKKHKNFIHFLSCQGLSNDDVGVARGTVFQEIRPGVGFKTGDFVEDRLGGGGGHRIMTPFLFLPQIVFLERYGEYYARSP